MNARVEAPNATFAAFEIRPGGGAHLAAKSVSGTNDLWRLDANGAAVWHASLPGQIAAITASDDPYIIGSMGDIAFTMSFDSLGGRNWARSEVTRSVYTGNGATVLADGRLAVCGATAPSGIFIDAFFLRDLSQINNTFYCGYVATLEIAATARPVFRLQPRDQKFAVRGENVTLHAEVFSPSAVTLRWYKDGKLIPGQTSTDLNLFNAQATDGGSYFLEAQNAGGISRSTTVNVTINSLTVSTVSGTDAPGTFDAPRSPIVLPDGSILAVDPAKNLIKRVTPTAVTTFAGSGAPGLANGLPLDAMFSSPSGLALEFRFNGPIVYVADRGNNLIRRIHLSTETSDALAIDSIDSDFAAPATVATLDGVRFIVTGTSASAGLWKYDEEIVTPLQGSVGSGAIGGMALDERANLYLTDVSMNEIRRTSPANQVDTIATGLNAPTGIALDDGGNLYVTERGSHIIRKISATGVKTIVAGLGVSGFQNGSSSQASFNAPDGICFRNGSLIVADSGNHCLREITFTPLNGNDPGDANLLVEVGSALTLSISAPTGASFEIQSSAQLGPGAQWQSEGSVTAGAGQSLTLTKPAATRFYRARQLP